MEVELLFVEAAVLTAKAHSHLHLEAVVLFVEAAI